MADKKVEKTKELGDKLQNEVEMQARIATEKVKTYARNNPMQVLLGGVILGLIIGTMIPRAINIRIEDKRKAVN